MPLTIRVEFNILRFEAPAPQRAIMGAFDVASEFGRCAAAAVTILAEVCPDETFAAKRVATRRAKQEDFDWPPNAASLERETPEPRLLVTAFPSRMLDALCQNELVSSCTWEGELIVAESDYLACHPASRECFRPLADYSDHPTLINLLLAAHSETPTLAVRDGVCAPRGDVNFCTSPADPRSAEHSVCKTSRNRSDSHQRWPRADVPAKEQALKRSGNLSRPWSLRQTTLNLSGRCRLKTSTSPEAKVPVEKYSLKESYFEGIKASF